MHPDLVKVAGSVLGYAGKGGAVGVAVGWALSWAQVEFPCTEPAGLLSLVCPHYVGPLDLNDENVRIVLCGFVGAAMGFVLENLRSDGR